MIAKLRGTLDSMFGNEVVVDVNGVGYLLFCSGRTQSALGTPGDIVTLMVETHVREDHIHLYGFATHHERDWFRLLTTVQGVGARVALAILSVMGPDDLLMSIAAQDKTAITRADGVGPKLAGRIVSELKDKVAGMETAPVAAPSGAGRGAEPAGTGTSSAMADAISALVNLGYGRTEAFAAVNTAGKSLGAEADVSALVTAGLKELAA